MTKNEAIAIAYFKTLVESFIAHPQDLKVSAIEDADWVSVRPSCNSKDFGRIVGSGGKLYIILKMLMGLAGKKAGKEFLLQRMAPAQGDREFINPTPAKENWSKSDTEKVGWILRDIAKGVLKNDFAFHAKGDTERTVLKIAIDDNEPLPIQHEDLIFALSRIIGAVGNVLGREIKVESA
jgi:predicted RNA-binding protein YlqC (UPF0109 family)